jgi:para-aminobenzoate synthetase/4-amino-4-deoxychorismate lyase
MPGAGAPPRVRVDFANPWRQAGQRWCWTAGAPERTWVAHHPHEVAAVLDAAHDAARQGAWCAGHVRYEAAAAFDPALRTHAADGPLACFSAWTTVNTDPTVGADVPWPLPPLPWRLQTDRTRFEHDLGQIRQTIEAGGLYQLNLTSAVVAPLPAVAPVDVGLRLFAALLQAQPGGYAAHLTGAGDEQVLSVSPELFLAWRGDELLCRPMKGTAPRHPEPATDQALAQGLRTSPKERAENVMIVDLLRNDLSRIATPHSVKVPHLFDVQPLPTVWQMTSDVCAQARPGLTLSAAFAALFPCGSITGAPKVAAMDLIRRLEPGPRGVYCGAVGVMAPGGEVRFNVPIRTVTLQGAQARCGVGSGITLGSHPDGEWAEWGHKQAFLTQATA